MQPLDMIAATENQIILGGIGRIIVSVILILLDKTESVQVRYTVDECKSLSQVGVVVRTFRS